MVLCCCSITKSCPSLFHPMNCSTQASLFFTISRSLLKFMPIESLTLSNHLILCHPLLLLPSIFLSISVCLFYWVSSLHRPKDWNFSFSISPSNEYLGFISFRMDWFEFLAVQRLSRVFSSTTVQKHQYLVLSLLYGPILTSVHDY